MHMNAKGQHYELQSHASTSMTPQSPFFLCHFRVSICIFLLLHASQSATPWETGPTPASWGAQRGERGHGMCFNTTIQTLGDKKKQL